MSAWAAALASSAASASTTLESYRLRPGRADRAVAAQHGACARPGRLAGPSQCGHRDRRLRRIILRRRCHDDHCG